MRGSVNNLDWERGNTNYADKRIKQAHSLMVQASLDVWKRAQTFRELLFLNTVYFRGRLFATPFQYSPLFTDSIALQDVLTKLATVGFYSIEGQGHTNDFSCDKNGCNQHLQKPYIRGFMKTKQLPQLVGGLMDESEVIVIAHDMQRDIQISNTGFKGVIHVTKYRDAPSKQHLKSARWTYFTNVYIEDENGHEELKLAASIFNPALYKELSNSVSLVTVIYNKWTAPPAPLETLMKNILESSAQYQIPAHGAVYRNLPVRNRT